MTEEQKRVLEKQLWGVANFLRNKIHADEYRNYILGFIFYKYLSEKLERHANEKLLVRDEITFTEIKENTKEGKGYLKATEKACVGHLGFFLKPTELFSYLVKKGKGEIYGQDTFILEDLKNILNRIEQTSMGTASEDDFKGLFDDVDLTSSKLGSSENKKNEVIVEVMSLLNGIDFKLEDSKSDLLGDAYEYLIGEFAAGAGKKSGEFYTPAQVSRLLARIVSIGKRRVRSVFDPTCGSGSLLLHLKDYTEVADYYGQELNPTTFNLARMNMILHGVPFDHFKIKQGDTLTEDMHPDLKAEVVVANPPFSAEWKGDTDPQLAHDDRFSQYGRLAPKKKADYAFITHMLYHLANNGTMAIVLPHGTLFRGGAEEHIRKYIIEKQNYLDAVIGLPANLFYGTGIPATILVFKKCRQDDEYVIFIDASKEFDQVKNQNKLTDENIAKIFDAYKNRKEIDKYSHKASLAEIKENEYNLSIPRYVDTFEEEAKIDIEETTKRLSQLAEKEREVGLKISKVCDELNLPKCEGNNIYLLKEYKKGVMQKIFSQEIRFKDNKGMSFPKWEEKNLGEILKERKEYSTKGKGYTHISLTTKGVVPKSERYERDFLVGDDEVKKYKITRLNDLCYNPANLKFNVISINNLREGIFSPIYVTFEIVEQNIDFVGYYLIRDAFINKARRYEQGTVYERTAVSPSDFVKVKVVFPSLSEQEKIADFLTSIDKAIELKEQQITHAGQWKKGLMQNLFI